MKSLVTGVSRSTTLGLIAGLSVFVASLFLTFAAATPRYSVLLSIAPKDIRWVFQNPEQARSAAARFVEALNTREGKQALIGRLPESITLEDLERCCYASLGAPSGVVHVTITGADPAEILRISRSIQALVTGSGPDTAALMNTHDKAEAEPGIGDVRPSHTQTVGVTTLNSEFALRGRVNFATVSAGTSLVERSLVDRDTSRLTRSSLTLLDGENHDPMLSEETERGGFDDLMSAPATVIESNRSLITSPHALDNTLSTVLSGGGGRFMNAEPPGVPIKNEAFYLHGFQWFRPNGHMEPATPHTPVETPSTDGPGIFLIDNTASKVMRSADWPGQSMSPNSFYRLPSEPKFTVIYATDPPRYDTFASYIMPLSLALLTSLLAGFAVFKFSRDSLARKGDVATIDRLLSIEGSMKLQPVPASDLRRLPPSLRNIPGYAFRNPASAHASSLRKLRSLIWASMSLQPGLKVTAVVSDCGEADSTGLALALARTFSAAGRQALLIDCRSSGGAIDRYLSGQHGRGKGLSDLLSGAMGWTDVVVTDVESGAHLLPAGLSAGKIRRTEDERFFALLKAKAPDYDCIILDLGPIESPSDCRAVISQASFVVLATVGTNLALDRIRSALGWIRDAKAHACRLILMPPQTLSLDNTSAKTRS